MGRAWVASRRVASFVPTADEAIRTAAVAAQVARDRRLAEVRLLEDWARGRRA